MKLALFTDIHGNKEALEAIIKDIQKKGIGNVYSLGDIIGIGPSSSECVDLVLNNGISNCLGNHEDYLLQGTNDYTYLTKEEINHHIWVNKSLNKNQVSAIKKMPRIFDLKIGGFLNKKRICLCHFPIDSTTGKFYHLSNYKYSGTDYLKLGNEKYDKLFFGHEHRPHTKDDKFINLPSSGCVPTNITHYYILDLDTLEYQKVEVEFDREKLIDKIDNGYPLSYKYKRYFGE